MKFFKDHILPSTITILICLILIVLLFSLVTLLNLSPTSHKIIPQLRIIDIFIGITIYLKTSIDFALVICNMIKNNFHWKQLLAIEIGTSLGNGTGTLCILVVWTFFKEVPLLLFIMIVLASLVLFQMAQESLEEYVSTHSSYFAITQTLHILSVINAIFHPILKYIIPTTKGSLFTKRPFLPLLFISFSIPFILGLDDFAGYIPLFSLINIVGFATGVFVGHALLLLALFASPKHTAYLITQPLIALLGSFAFIGIGLYGLREAVTIFSQVVR